jgi:hypothetical protein
MGWCIGCPLVDGVCTVRIRDCPVVNTPEELRAHKIEDAEAALIVARKLVAQYQTLLSEAINTRQALYKALEALKEEPCSDLPLSGV